MTESEWLNSMDPERVLEHLGQSGMTSERKVRLFGCACCRMVWHLFTDDRSRRAVEVVERYADGQVTDLAMAEVEKMASEARDLAVGMWGASRRHRSWAGRNTSWAAYAMTNVPPLDGDRFRVVVEDVNEAAARARDVKGRIKENIAIQTVLLRCIWGNPFRPPLTLAPTIRGWHEGTVVKLAARIYEERDFTHESLGILADALEEAGCTDTDILTHLRGPGPHVRGCWVVDLVLGKE